MRESHLLALGMIFGLKRTDLVQAERPERLYIDCTINAATLSKIDEYLLGNLRSGFGASLRIELGTPGLDPELIIESSHSTEAILESIRDVLKPKSDRTLQMTLAVNKSRLVEEIDVPYLGPHRKVLFLFTDNVKGFLSTEDTFRLCQMLFLSGEEPVFIILAEGNISVDGHFLHIRSESQLVREEVLQPIPESVLRAKNSLSQLAFSAVRWIGFQFPSITPLHFQFLPYKETSDNVEIVRLLYTHFVVLFIIHTANIVLLTDRHIEVTYASASGDQVTKTIIDKQYSLEPRIYQNALELLQWLVENGGEEKLRFLQTVIAKDLQESVTTEELLSHMEQVFRDAKHYYTISIDGKVSKHFDSIQSITRYVAQTSAEIGGAVDNLTKGLNDAVVAAIGVVIGGLITAVTGGKTTDTIFSILMLTYVAYIIGFQLIFRMTVIYNSFQILSDAADLQITEYRNRLGVTRTTQLTASLQRRKKQFLYSFYTTLVVFTALAFIFGFLATRGSEILLPQSTSSPLTATPSLTSTAIPTITFTPSVSTSTSPANVAATATP